MEQRFDVGDDGYLVGLRVEGFHGHARAGAMPAIKSPLVLTEDQRIARPLSEDASHQLCALSRVVDPRALEGDYVRFDAAQKLRPGQRVLCLGLEPGEPSEWLVRAVQRREASLSEGSVRFMRAACGLGGRGSWLRARGHDGHEFLAWLSGAAEVREVCDTVRAGAQDRLVRAALSENHAELERAAWWFQRASSEDSDVELVAASLERAGSPGARRLLASYLPDASERELAAALRRGFALLRQHMGVALLAREYAAQPSQPYAPVAKRVAGGREGATVAQGAIAHDAASAAEPTARGRFKEQYGVH